jgi:hypothetical protein
VAGINIAHAGMSTRRGRHASRGISRLLALENQLATAPAPLAAEPAGRPPAGVEPIIDVHTHFWDPRRVEPSARLDGGGAVAVPHSALVCKFVYGNPNPNR